MVLRGVDAGVNQCGFHAHNATRAAVLEKCMNSAASGQRNWIFLPIRACMQPSRYPIRKARSIQTYASPQTVKDKMQYFACFLLHNLAHQDWITWQEADRVHERASLYFKAPSTVDTWNGGRRDPEADRSFGRRLSGLIECEDCGQMFGHKTWRSGTPNRTDVWECRTNHAKRGTCKPSHLYETVL